MTLEELSIKIKKEFTEISEALFNKSLNITYIESTNRIFGEGGPMFSANIIKFSETNFEYFYYYHKYLITNLDIINLRDLKSNFPKLDTKGDILSIDFIKQVIDNGEVVENVDFFYELNFIANLFVFFHECGHVNQIIPPAHENVEAKHFSEFNSDYYAITTILNYYYTLRKKFPDIYFNKVSIFNNEHDLIRSVIVSSIIVVYFECLSDLNNSDTQDHPFIRKRFCYLIYQTQIQLNSNFEFLFKNDKLSDFLKDIFQTLDFIENKMFAKESLIFNDILDYCSYCYDEVIDSMKHFQKFEHFNK